MGKRRQRKSLQMEKDEAGCMRGLIRMFDIRDGRSTRKFLTDRKRGSPNPAGEIPISHIYIIDTITRGKGHSFIESSVTNIESLLPMKEL